MRTFHPERTQYSSVNSVRFFSFIFTRDSRMHRAS